jgi:shikimate kinase
VLSVAGGWAVLRETIGRLLAQRLHTTLADFDDHLDDLSKDWTNPQLSKLGRFELPGQQR